MLSIHYDSLSKKSREEQDDFLSNITSLIEEKRFAEALNGLLRNADVVNATPSSDHMERACAYYMAAVTKALNRDDLYARYTPVLGFVRPDFPPLDFGSHNLLTRPLETKARQARERGLPSIFVASLPKSASAFLTNSLSDAYDLATVRLAWDDDIEEHYFSYFLKGGCITHNHLPATPANLAYLGRLRPAVAVIQLRDPRQAVWSMFHHHLTMEGRIDVKDLIRHGYGILTARVEGWLQAATELESQGVHPLLVDYEDIRRDSAGVLHRVRQAFGLDAAVLDAWLAADQERRAPNFRSGDTDEWRRGIPPELVAEIEDATPRIVREHYGF